MVDFVRSCYEVDARFYVDQPDRISKMIWSFVDHKTPPMPFAHCFGSRVWEADEGEQAGPIGELDTPRRWSGGIAPFPLPVLGNPKNANFGLCGEERQWVTGSVAGDVVPPTWPHSRVKRCCKRPPELGQGGYALGKRAGTYCGACQNQPRTIFATVQSQPGFCTLLNGVWPMVWVSDPIFPRWEAFHRLPNNRICRMFCTCYGIGNFYQWVIEQPPGPQGGLGPIMDVRCEPFRLRGVAFGFIPFCGCSLDWQADFVISE